MDEKEFQALVEKLGKEAAEEIKKRTAELEKTLNEKFKGTLTKEELEDYKKTVEKANEDLLVALKAQGVKLAEIESARATKEDPFVHLQKELTEKANQIKDIIANKSGMVSITLKAAGVTATVGLGGNSASILENGSAAALLRLGEGEVFAAQRGTPFILDFVTVGNTNASALVWFDENDRQGSFAITPEGTLKPLVQYIFTRQTSSYKKAAGRVIITEEFDQDYPRLVSMIKQLMTVDVRNDMNDQILTDLIAAAAPYAYNGLDGSVDNADDYAAIGAAIAQIQSFYYKPNVLVLNVADAWRMRLQKDTQGRYIMPPFTWNGVNYEFGKVIIDPRVPAGNFFVGDGSVFHVELKGDVVIRMGYGASTDDFNKNQFTLIAEQYFFDWISAARKAGLVYGNFATIKADIEQI